MIIFIETLHMVVKVFRVNKLRTMLTMLGIIIGIFSVTIIFAVSDGTNDKLSKEFQEMDQTTISLTFNDIYDEKGIMTEKIIPPSDALANFASKSDVIRNVSVSSPRIWKEKEEEMIQQDLEHGVDKNKQQMYSPNDEGANQIMRLDIISSV